MALEVEGLTGAGHGERSADRITHREADHLAKQIGIGALLQKRAQGHHVLGHRGSPSGQVGLHYPNPKPEPRWPPLWIAGLPTPDSRRSLRQAAYPQLPEAPTTPTPRPGTRPLTLS